MNENFPREEKANFGRVSSKEKPMDHPPAMPLLQLSNIRWGRSDFASAGSAVSNSSLGIQDLSEAGDKTDLPLTPPTQATIPQDNQSGLHGKPSNKRVLKYERKNQEKGNNGNENKKGSWDVEEHDRVIEAAKRFKGVEDKWKKISKYVGKRTREQCKSHLQKFKESEENKKFIPKGPKFKELNRYQKYLNKQQEDLAVEGEGSLIYRINQQFGPRALDMSRLTKSLAIIDRFIEFKKSKLNEEKRTSPDP